MRRRVDKHRFIVSPEAINDLLAAGARAKPRETGGCLIGYRLGENVVVGSVLELEDPHATAHSFMIRHHPLQAALDEQLPTQPPGFGYVGPWHCHHGRTGHSRQDRQSLRRIARQYSAPIASVVVKTTNNELEAFVARGRRRPARAEIEIADLDDMPAPIV